jgi:hypothetical protein
MVKNLQSKQEKDAATNRDAIETTGEVFSDGSILELIHHDSGADETALLRWDGQNATIGWHFEVDGHDYRPPKSSSTFPSAFRLPGGISSYGSTRHLFDEICNLLIKFTDICEKHVQLIAYFILGSWLADRLLVAPFLFTIAPFGAPRAQLLRLLSCLCRRPLMLAGVTPAAISKLANLRPTFIFDEPNLSRHAERFLYASNNSGGCIYENDRIVNIFSAKVICSREPLRDAFLASQALEIAIAPAGRQVPFLDHFMCGQIADEFQRKLLQYRLTNFAKVRTPELDVSELADSVQDVARAFASCVADDAELRDGVVGFLRERDQDVYRDASTDFVSAILEGLLFYCHSQGRSQVLAGELADTVNTLWAKRGEGRKTSPESVGWKLRALNLRTEPIDGAGKGLRLTESVRTLIHDSARAYRIPTLRRAVQGDCRHCKPAFENQRG